ncbi:helix-turn-helix protein [Kitasatospora sp. SolWspMP-SS2h]|uniref:helix-turn-helix domain-containing protein n=1 Tax=Kitasatospora sp. SolWspMP-SS2h TaxID=1305729 RepID=UPI000DB97849|nr:helix-turn-helix transcriptional regulator [Kitasatospora sp. SolWspMP-SS2h]RAJ41880.1 helix-turn-helix protein [Kitasatospora sp. SolWspMP-SS2h]
METSTALGDFLRNRRARLRPEDAGLTPYPNRRRVPGLRREELAMLAGVSVTYYTRLEQGHSANASDGVLDALARALRLTGDERAHLYDLARPARAGRTPQDRPAKVRPATRHLIDAMPQVPAVVLDRGNDVLAWNALGHALLAGHLDPTGPDRPADRPNLTRLLFLDPHTRELHARWEEDAKVAVAALRLAVGRHPQDRRLAHLVGQLAIQSPEFAALWARHPVRDCAVGSKSFRHPLVGPMELHFESLPLSDGTTHRVLLYGAAPDSPSAAALALLSRSSRGSWPAGASPSGPGGSGCPSATGRTPAGPR